jgi:hypothetical protein
MNLVKLILISGISVASIAAWNTAMAETKAERCAAYARKAAHETPTTTGPARGAAGGAIGGAIVGVPEPVPLLVQLLVLSAPQRGEQLKKAIRINITMINACKKSNRQDLALGLRGASG